MSISAVQTDTLQPFPLAGSLGNVQSPGTQVELCTGDLWRADGDNRWRMIICQRGEIWITQERDLQDYVLTAGQMFLGTQRGRVIVQALEDACLHITPSLQKAPYVGSHMVFP